jgi:glycerophosphoryl diester phosphodiesterase
VTPLPPAFLGAPIAHRGLHDRGAGRIENSLSAVAAAAAAGYGIEIDVQVSADGQAMVFHDETLERLTAEAGAVAARPADALGRIALAGGGGDRIPTLPAVLAAVAGRVPLLIELKDRTQRLAGTDGRLETAVAAALAGYGGPVAVMSFNPDMVAAMAAAAPQVPRGLTTAAFGDDWAPLDTATRDRLRAIPDYDRTGAAFISHEAADLGRPRVAALKAAGAAVLCWTVRSAAAEAAARRIADNVTFEGYAAAIPA